MSDVVGMFRGFLNNAGLLAGSPSVAAQCNAIAAGLWPTVQFRRLSAAALTPTRAHPGDAALDLYAAHSAVLSEAAAVAVVGTGIAMAIPPGWCGIVKERSGLATRGIAVRGGVIDSGYRGEIKVLLQCLHLAPDAGDLRIYQGDRIAQLLLVRVPTLRLEEVAELPESDRGTAGFGSTGA